MAKFIVTIDVGSEPCSGEHHIAVDCDSIEELYSALMDAAKARIKFRQENERPYYTPNTNMEEWSNAVVAWDQADKVSRYPVVCGTVFEIDELIDVGHDKHHKLQYYINEHPQIRTFDEWFEDHKYTCNYG